MRLILDEQDLAILNEALIRLPYGQVAPLIAKINEQMAAQQRLAALEDEWQPPVTHPSPAGS